LWEKCNGPSRKEKAKNCEKGEKRVSTLEVQVRENKQRRRRKRNIFPPKKLPSEHGALEKSWGKKYLRDREKGENTNGKARRGLRKIVGEEKSSPQGLA